MLDHTLALASDATGRQRSTGASEEKRSAILRFARKALHGVAVQPLRDTAIELIREHDPAKARSSYRFHVAIACDARRDARTRAASLDWLAANTASTDQIGQARLDRLRSGAMTTGEPG